MSIRLFDSSHLLGLSIVQEENRAKLLQDLQTTCSGKFHPISHTFASVDEIRRYVNPKLIQRLTHVTVKIMEFDAAILEKFTNIKHLSIVSSFPKSFSSSMAFAAKQKIPSLAFSYIRPNLGRDQWRWQEATSITCKNAILKGFKTHDFSHLKDIQFDGFDLQSLLTADALPKNKKLVLQNGKFCDSYLENILQLDPNALTLINCKILFDIYRLTYKYNEFNTKKSIQQFVQDARSKISTIKEKAEIQKARRVNALSYRHFTPGSGGNAADCTIS